MFSFYEMWFLIEKLFFYKKKKKKKKVEGNNFLISTNELSFQSFLHDSPINIFDKRKMHQLWIFNL